MSASTKSQGQSKPDIEVLPFHTFADIFPLMKGDEFEEFVGDIKRRGLNEPITRYQDKILDGRNRARACAKAGVQPRYHEFVGTDEDAKRYVISANILRRHLTPDDRRKHLKKLLGMSPEMSDRAIGKQVGCSHSTVAAVRHELEANGQIGHKKRQESSGRNARGRKPITHKPPPAPSSVISTTTTPVEDRAALELIAQPPILTEQAVSDEVPPELNGNADHSQSDVILPSERLEPEPANGGDPIVACIAEVIPIVRATIIKIDAEKRLVFFDELRKAVRTIMMEVMARDADADHWAETTGRQQ
jgi:ParB-like chromosome segregation protein Spo0J